MQSQFGGVLHWTTTASLTASTYNGLSGLFVQTFYWHLYYTNTHVSVTSWCSTLLLPYPLTASCAHLNVRHILTWYSVRKGAFLSWCIFCTYSQKFCFRTASLRWILSSGSMIGPRSSGACIPSCSNPCSFIGMSLQKLTGFNLFLLL